MVLILLSSLRLKQFLRLFGYDLFNIFSQIFFKNLILSSGTQLITGGLTFDCIASNSIENNVFVFSQFDLRQEASEMPPIS